jgi:hypothetical protein
VFADISFPLKRADVVIGPVSFHSGFQSNPMISPINWIGPIGLVREANWPAVSTPHTESESGIPDRIMATLYTDRLFKILAYSSGFIVVQSQYSPGLQEMPFGSFGLLVPSGLLYAHLQMSHGQKGDRQLDPYVVVSSGIGQKLSQLVLQNKPELIAGQVFKRPSLQQNIHC